MERAANEFLTVFNDTEKELTTNVKVLDYQQLLIWKGSDVDFVQSKAKFKKLIKTIKPPVAPPASEMIISDSKKSLPKVGWFTKPLVTGKGSPKTSPRNFSKNFFYGDRVIS